MAQQPGIRTICVLAADKATTANTVLSNVTGMLFAAAAGTKYVIEATLPFSLANANPGFKFQLLLPAAPTYYMQNTFVVADDATITLERTDLATTSIGNTLANAGNHVIKVMAYLECGVAGTVQLQWAQNVSDAGATTLMKGAIMNITQVS
jgi:hypothetical protein